MSSNRIGTTAPPSEGEVEAVARAIQAAEDSSLKIEGFYYVNHPGGPHVIRDFRTDRNGPVLWVGEDRECYNRELERLKLQHIARAAIAALPRRDEGMREALERLIEAATCIHHWHDAHDGGMVVSGSHVRALWEETERARAALTPEPR